MCGRYTGYVDESGALRSIYTALEKARPSLVLARGEIFPADTVPMLTAGAPGSLTIGPAIWGWEKPPALGRGLIINARWETAPGKPLFADSFRRRRCVLPTTGWLEWDSGRKKHRFTLAGRSELFLAGLWQDSPAGQRFTILTRPAQGAAAAIHPRMPVALPEEALLDWVGGGRLAGVEDADLRIARQA